LKQPVVLYGCETWSLALSEEYRLREYEIRVLGRIFGPKREEVVEDWRRLHNEELHNLNTSQNIIGMIKFRRVRWEGHIARIEEIINPCIILVGKPEGKKTSWKT
jgi:hypothetical protein